MTAVESGKSRVSEAKTRYFCRHEVMPYIMHFGTESWI